MSFTLADQSGLLTVTELARALGVGDQTVYNYEKRGMEPAGTGPAGEKLWDPAKAREWVKLHGPSRIRGGKRAGAGRKPASEREKPKPTGELIEIFEEAEERLLASGVPAAVAKNAGEIEALMEAVKSDRLTLEQIERVQAGIRTIKELIEVRRKEGELVSRKETEAELGQYLKFACITLDNLPGRAATEISGMLGLDPAKTIEVRERIKEQVAAVKRQLQGRQ